LQTQKTIDFKHLGIKIGPITHKKLKALAKFEKRSVNKELLHLVDSAIFKHEKKYGKLE